MLVLFLLMFFSIVVAAAHAAGAVLCHRFFPICRNHSHRHSFIFVGELIATEMKNIKWLDRFVEAGSEDS